MLPHVNKRLRKVKSGKKQTEKKGKHWYWIYTFAVEENDLWKYL